MLDYHETFKFIIKLCTFNMIKNFSSLIFVSSEVGEIGEESQAQNTELQMWPSEAG